MYNKILNPVTGKFVNINTKQGKYIIQKYLTLLLGSGENKKILNLNNEDLSAPQDVIDDMRRSAESVQSSIERSRAEQRVQNDNININYDITENERNDLDENKVVKLDINEFDSCLFANIETYGFDDNVENIVKNEFIISSIDYEETGINIELKSLEKYPSISGLIQLEWSIRIPEQSIEIIGTIIE